MGTYKALRVSVLVLTPFIGLFWLIILLAETNRTPFDFSEGESELVSGFNVEYASIGFVLIFLREYAIIILFSCVSVSLFIRASPFRIISRLAGVGVTGVWFIIRATLPRYRYDLLINLAWKSYLPVRLFAIIGVSLLLRV